MKLVRFQVTKYRNIQDSRVVELFDTLTCIVGKNQSGKTSLLRALHKFNPHDKNEKYNLSRDWPRGERRQKDEKHIVCKIIFELDPEEKTELAKMASGTMDATEVAVTKNYAGEYEVNFPSHPDLFPDRLHPNVIDELCRSLPALPSPVGEGFATAANECVEAIRRIAREGLFGELPNLEVPQTARLNEARSPNNPQPQHQNENNFVAALTKKVARDCRTNSEITNYARKCP